MDYAIYLATLTLLFAGLAISLNILVGFCGIISVAHAAFFGLGAYSAVLAERYFSVPPLLTPGLAFFVGLTSGYLLARIALRIRDDYLVIFTLCFQIVLTNVLLNGGQITGGPTGLTAIPPLLASAPEFRNAVDFLGALAATGICISTSIALRRAPYGRALMAVREDELFATSLGKNAAALKTSAFATAASLAAIMGAFYAPFIGFIDPTQFSVAQSISVVSMVIVGGAGRIWGPVAGAALIVLLPELLRALGLPGALTGNVRQIAFGLLLTLFVALRPHGLLGENVFVKDR